MREFDEIAERAVARIDAVIVGDVVAAVLVGRGLKRHQPERADAKAVQIIEPAQQTLEVTDAVAVGVHEGADGEAIDHAVLVPEVVYHPGASGPHPGDKQPRWLSVPQWRPPATQKLREGRDLLAGNEG